MSADATHEQAKALIAEVQRLLEDGDAQLRALGFNPDKVRGIGQHLSPEQQAEAAAAAAADLAAVDQEVAEEAARRAHAGGASTSAPKPRRPRGFV